MSNYRINQSAAPFVGAGNCISFLLFAFVFPPSSSPHTFSFCQRKIVKVARRSSEMFIKGHKKLKFSAPKILILKQFKMYCIILCILFYTYSISFFFHSKKKVFNFKIGHLVCDRSINNNFRLLPMLKKILKIGKI